jgi:hypothetical protein
VYVWFPAVALCGDADERGGGRSACCAEAQRLWDVADSDDTNGHLRERLAAARKRYRL